MKAKAKEETTVVRSSVVAKVVCKTLGHDWVPRSKLKYAGCWCCDEVCSRCGAETWWPS